MRTKHVQLKMIFSHLNLVLNFITQEPIKTNLNILGYQNFCTGLIFAMFAHSQLHEIVKHEKFTSMKKIRIIKIYV